MKSIFLGCALVLGVSSLAIAESNQTACYKAALKNPKVFMGMKEMVKKYGSNTYENQLAERITSLCLQTQTATGPVDCFVDASDSPEMFETTKAGTTHTEGSDWTYNLDQQLIRLCASHI
jgi:hypothetical protein